jgi:hypothetical protein
MQIVINIDDEDYDDITLTGENTINLGVLLDLREAVRKGSPLPKGHGRLIDADAINLKDISPVDGFSVYGATAEDIDFTLTIIEADRSEEE